ncbi:type II toxin-antitoxin system HicA family toxin [Breznakiellaceae bacterium SP9]
MPMTGKEMMRKLQQAGWVLDHIRGSHHYMKKGTKQVGVPVHAKDLGKGLENKILTEAGLK